jgi:hypothetical protein
MMLFDLDRIGDLAKRRLICVDCLQKLMSLY